MGSSTAGPGQPPTQESGATQEAIPPPPAEGSTRRRRHRVWKAIVIVVGTLIALAAAGAVLQPGDGTFLVENFDSDTIQFTTDSDRVVEQTVEDGAYHIEIKDPTAPQYSRFVFRSTRDAVRFEADISGSGEGGWAAGVGCWAGDSAYVFAMFDSGDVVLLELGDGRRSMTEPTMVDSILQPTEPTRLRIDCVGGGAEATIVSGWVNGEPIVSVADPGGWDSFMAVGIFAFAEEAGTSFRVDNVIGVEDRPEAGVSPVPPITREPFMPTAASASIVVSDRCDAVFADAKTSYDAGFDELGDATVGNGAPQECATMAEAAAAAAEYFGPDTDEGLQEYLSGACAYTGWAVEIRDTDLCQELLAGEQS